MNRTIVGLVLVVLVLLLVQSCFFPTRTHRALKVTVEVDTPLGPRTGSSVIDFVTRPVPAWLPGGGGVSMQVIGEAPVVDLGGGQLLYVLLRDQYGSRSLSALLDERRREADGTVKHNWLPMLVTFPDSTDAASIVEVSPDNLQSVFGPGYALRRITAVPTTDKPTFGVLKTIPVVRDGILNGTLEQSIAKSSSIHDKGTATSLTRLSFQESAPK